ncbi:MAG: hypothetical protein GEU81_07210 [Nitriliruptorales bacterium]|nr:hypothetical protein [Nitriliruptorales bacterium]
MELSRYHRKVVERMEPALREEETVLYCGPVKVRLPSHPLGRVRGRAIVTEQRLHTVTRLVQIIQPREQIADISYGER